MAKTVSPSREPFDVTAPEPLVFAINLRVPDWCSNASIRVNGSPITVGDDGYVTIERAWEADRIEARFEQSITPVSSHPAVEANANRVALTRGPLVYCLEGVDHDRLLHHLSVDPAGPFEATYRNDLLGGIVTVEGDAHVPSLEAWDGERYRPDAETECAHTVCCSSLPVIAYWSSDRR